MYDMNTTTKATDKNKKVAAAFMDAITAMNNAESTVLKALTEMYGEDDANTFFCKMPFKEVHKDIAHYMYINYAEML